MANSGDYYAVLGVQGLTCLLRSVSKTNPELQVARDASEAEIKKAYRKDSIDSIIFTRVL